MDDAFAARRRLRTGLALFALYVLAYAAFMVVNVAAPARMAARVGGITVAVWSGLGLIAGAIVLAAIYVWRCARIDAPEAP